MIEPLVRTVEVADLLSVRLAAADTVVLVLAQLVVEHDEPGVAGLVPPVESTEA